MTVIRPIALITGASAGLGTEFARCAAADGYDLVLVARRLDRLDAIATEIHARYGSAVRTRAVDLADRGMLAAFCTEITEGRISAEILVNNAGVGLAGTFAGSAGERIAALLDIDIAAPTTLMRAALPGMIARGRGHVLNVASLAAFQPGPNAAAYSAAKAYLKSLSQAVAYELRGTGVRITAVCPGPVATEFADASGLQVTRLFSGLLPVEDAARIARVAWAAMKRGRRLVIPGLRPRILAAAAPLTPDAVKLRLASFLLGVRPGGMIRGP